MPRTAYNWSGSELACWDSVASHNRCPKRTYRRAIVIDGRLWCHFPIAVWMREGGTLSLVETKVVSIIFLLSVFPLQLIAVANGRYWRINSRPRCSCPELPFRYSEAIVIVNFFSKSLVRLMSCTSGADTSLLAVSHCDRQLSMDVTCETEHFFSPFRGVHTVRNRHADDAVISRLLGPGVPLLTNRLCQDLPMILLTTPSRWPPPSVHAGHRPPGS